MPEQPQARILFYQLACLPDGFPLLMQDNMESYIPQFQSLVRVLRRVALVQITKELDSPRIHILAPIQLFCTKFEIDQQMSISVQRFYTDLIIRNANYTNPVLHGIIVPEVNNMLQVFNDSYGKGVISEDLVDASLKWTQWMVYMGQASNILIQHSKNNAINEKQQGDCHFTEGEVQLFKSDLDEAEGAFTQALELHTQAQDVPRQATDLQRLGDLHIQRDNLDKAEEAFTRALEFHIQAQDVTSKANDLQRLGDLHMQRDNLDKAEETFTRALELHTQAQYVLGQANDLNSLGDLYICRDDLGKTEEAFITAL